VTGVHNHLQVALPDGDFRDDAKLTTAASNALAGNVTVPDTVKATAADGHIYLTGTVAYGTERAAAEAAVTGLTGVRNVIDDIEISYVIDPVDVDLHVQQADRPSPTWAEHNAAVSAALMAQGSSTSAMKPISPADRHHRGPPRRRLADLSGRHDRQGRSPRSRGPAPAPVHLAGERGLDVLLFGQHPGGVADLGHHPGRGDDQLPRLSG
jgi:BON domain